MSISKLQNSTFCGLLQLFSTVLDNISFFVFLEKSYYLPICVCHRKFFSNRPTTILYFYRHGVIELSNNNANYSLYYSIENCYIYSYIMKTREISICLKYCHCLIQVHIIFCSKYAPRCYLQE